MTCTDNDISNECADVWEEGYISHDSYMDDMEHKNSCTYVSYFECVPVGIKHIERDFDVLLDALAAPLKLPPL